MINWTKTEEQLPTIDGHYLVITIEGFVKIQQARYYSSFHYGQGHFVVDRKIVDATYWAAANFPLEYL